MPGDAPHKLDHLAVVDSLGGGRGLAAARVRRGHGPLRHAAAGSDRGPARQLRDADRFRFANVLRAWIDVDEKGRITDYGQGGGGMMGSTTVKLGPRGAHVRGDRAARPRAEADQGRATGFASRRPRAGARACPPRDGCGASRSCSGRRRWCGRRSTLTIHADGKVKGADDRREPLPAPLGLRRRRQPLAQVGPRRLQGLVPQVLRQAHPLGRHRLQGARDGRGDARWSARSRRRSCRAARSRRSAR